MKPVREQLKELPYFLVFLMAVMWVTHHAIDDAAAIAGFVWRRWGQSAVCP